MYELVELGFEERRYKHKWQPSIVGLIERTLYIVTLLMGYAPFIGLWIGLKVSIPYIRWTGERNDKTDPFHGRSLFMVSLCGNALSILYAVVGYLIILWLNKGDMLRAGIVAGTLIVFNLSLWVRLKVYQKKHCPSLVDVMK